MFLICYYVTITGVLTADLLHILRVFVYIYPRSLVELFE